MRKIHVCKPVSVYIPYAINKIQSLCNMSLTKIAFKAEAKFYSDAWV